MFSEFDQAAAKGSLMVGAVQRHSPKLEPSETEKSDPKTDEGIEM
jgi:hypothetical protein